MSKEEKSEIAEWYNGQSIFITGGTGFMGKVLVEKLLYASPNIGNIYILMRNKRGKEPEKRIEEMWTLPMFQRLREAQPNAIKKIIPVHGDVNTENLGLNAADEKLVVDNVSVVFHCAATLRLEAELRDAVLMNTAGTEKVVDLAKKIKKLNVFVHLSTAFCSADIDVFMEKIYPSPHNAREVIKMVQWMDNEALKKVTFDIIKPHPNTYTYSKRLAESLVAQEADNMRVVIVRPSIVCPSSVEPIPGWVDNLNGPVGLMIAAGKGVIRSMHCNGENRVQIIPVDLAINAIIAIGWKIGSAKTKSKDVPVYNLTNDGIVTHTWREVLENGRKLIFQYPFEMQIWYPDGNIRSSKFIHNLCCLFFHWLPAIFIDFLLLITLQKRFMIRLQKRIHAGLELLQFFTTREWFFDTTNFVGLINEVQGKNKEMYPLDFEIIPMYEYMKVSLLGGRQYCMKEDLSSLPRCRVQIKIMYVIHKLFVYGFYFGLFYLLYSYFKGFKSLF